MEGFSSFQADGEIVGTGWAKWLLSLGKLQSRPGKALV